MASEDWSKHRERWLNRINHAERQAKNIENGIHSVLDRIEESNGDLTVTEIHSMLLELVRNDFTSN